MLTPADLDARQQVEGFASLVSQPNNSPIGGYPLGPDYRGHSASAMTREWFRPPRPDDPDLVWLTAPVPQTIDSTFVFAAESANLPENVFPPNQATLYAGDDAAVTFDLGQRQRRLWQQGDWAIEFIPKQVAASVDGVHRQFWSRGVCGIYRLAAPARALQAGQPLRLTVKLGPPRSDVITWFALRQRTDVLEDSAQTNAEQIQRVQDELIRLKRIVGGLARRSYPELFPERLATEDVLIYHNGLIHVSAPAALRLQNGDLLVVCREATEHISPDGRVVFVRSRDGGKTWGERQVLAETPGVDERDCSLCQLRDGTVLAGEWPNTSYDANGYYVGRPQPNPHRSMRVYVGRSTDNGLTWTWPGEPIDPTPLSWALTSEQIVELPSGRLLMVCYGSDDRWLDYGCHCYCSDDKGLSWRYLSRIVAIPGKHLGEPALVQAQSGRLICLIRNDDEGGMVYLQATSADGGVTWSEARPTPIPGHYNPAALAVLPDATVLCIYGARPRDGGGYARTDDYGGMYVVASYDEGETWDMARRRVLRDDLTNMDLGYPSLCLMPDGRVLAVYYYNLFGRFVVAGSFFRWQR